MTRPYVIIHTHTSIDGNIDFMAHPAFETASRFYRDIALTPEKQILKIGAYLNGKTSTEDNITHFRRPQIDENAAEVPGGDFIAAQHNGIYYISIDPRGELAWNANTYSYGDVPAHVVEVLTTRASNAYKDFLRRNDISYIIAGDDEIDYAAMLTKLSELGIERLMVAGGGVMNWSFLQHGLVDEVSMVLAPIANGDTNAHHFFTARKPYTTVNAVGFQLKSVQHIGGSVVWLRYTPT